MTIEKMMMGQLTLDMVAFTTMGNQEFKNQFESFVHAKIVLVMPNGEEKEFKVGEILKAKFESFEGDTGLVIEEAEEYVY